jgi:pSer/pThr/pTyr-binding forkhead associated (FHA) protein
MRITLTVTDGPHEGTTFAFEGHDTFLVGRSQRAHFQLPNKDRYFSRMHFLVEVNPPECQVMDLGSRNGTHVNGQRITRADLKNGDRIKAGHTILQVVVEKSENEPEQLGAIPIPEAVIPRVVATPSPPLRTPNKASEILTTSEALEFAAGRCTCCGAPVPANKHSPDLACPACRQAIREQTQLIPGYEIVRELGRGAMGVVHLAIRGSGGLAVALKTIKPAGPSTGPADIPQR